MRRVSNIRMLDFGVKLMQKTSKFKNVKTTSTILENLMLIMQETQLNSTLYILGAT